MGLYDLLHQTAHAGTPPAALTSETIDGLISRYYSEHLITGPPIILRPMPNFNAGDAQFQPGFALVLEEKKESGLITSGKSDFRVGVVTACGGEDPKAEATTLKPTVGDRILYRTYGNDYLEIDGEDYQLIPMIQIAALLDVFSDKE